MIFPCGLTSQKRYQLSQLADVDGLDERSYEHYRERILQGEVLFERVEKEVQPDRKYVPREFSEQAVIGYLKKHEAATAKELGVAINMSHLQVVRWLMPRLIQTGRVCARTIKRKGCPRVYFLPHDKNEEATSDA